MQKTMVEIDGPSSLSGESILVGGGGDNQIKSDQPAAETAPFPTKKRRNLPGMPDPDAEVIALSPKTLMATNRFVCEICNKGFQRDQNLQLHRRGHNLPWKLRQRTSKEPRKRVYVCPEASCVHHDPTRALGDLTGIKKHFCRKHGEKKHKCERCSKKYAVHSDWKAHMKTCGTREYPCDCGTVFSRRDSFITHRAFCDALAQESARNQTAAAAPPPVSSPPPPPLTPSTGVLSPVLSIQSSEPPENQISQLQPPPPPPVTTTSSSSTSSGKAGASVFAGIFSSSTTSELPQHHQPPPPPPPYSGSLLCPMPPPPFDPMSLSLSSSLYGAHPSLFPPPTHQNTQPPHPSLSATALLQKAAQMGSTSSSNSSFLRGLGLSLPSSSGPHHATTNVKLESNSLAFGLGLGVGPAISNSGFNEIMFGNKPAAATTLDFLGLGVGPGDQPSSDGGGFSAFLSSIGGGGGGGTTFVGGGDMWDDSDNDRKPTML
ncbi:hypothetical protein ABFX02_03G057900 [Erythranthe guttata]